MDWLTRMDPQEVADAMTGKQKPPRRIEAYRAKITREDAEEAIAFMQKAVEKKKIRNPTFEIEEDGDELVIYGIPHPEHAALDMFSKDLMNSIIGSYAVYFKEYMRLKEYKANGGTTETE